VPHCAADTPRTGDFCDLLGVMQCALFLAAAVAILLARTCAAQNTLGSCKGTTIDPRVRTWNCKSNFF